MSETDPAFVTNFGPAPSGTTPDVGVAQGEDIIVRDREGATNYFFYGLLEEIDPPSPKLISITWDGFNDGPKDGILVIHTKKSVTVTTPSGPKQVDIFLPKGSYRLVLRDDPTPFGSILGESTDFSIF